MTDNSSITKSPLVTRPFFHVFNSVEDSPLGGPPFQDRLSEEYVVKDYKEEDANFNDVHETHDNTVEKQPLELETLDLEAEGFDSHEELRSPDMEEFLSDNEKGYYDHCRSNQANVEALPEESRSEANENIDNLLTDEVLDSPIHTESELDDPIMTRNHIKCFNSSFNSKDLSPTKTESNLLPLFSKIKKEEAKKTPRATKKAKKKKQMIWKKQ